MNDEKEPRGRLPEDGAEREESPAAEQKQGDPEREEKRSAEPGKAAETAENPEKDRNPEDEKKGRGAFFKSSRFRHGSVSTAFTAGFLAAVILLNVLVGVLSDRFPSVNLDLTQGGANSLSAAGAKVVDSVKIPANVYVLATRQQVESDSLYADSGVKYSRVGSLLSKIAERNPKITVEYVDLDKNPTFAENYKNDNLAAGDVVVKTQKRYRVLTYTDLFDVQYGSDSTTPTQVTSNVEGALASAFSAVVSDKLPVVAFETGHDEQQDMSAYKKLLENNSFETKDFNLLTDKIPENAQMVVLACPTRDYTDEEIKKLSDFLGSKSVAGDRSLMATFYPSQAETPKLATFLEEWGLAVPRSVVVESDQSKFIANNPSYLLSDIQSDLPLRGDGGSGTDYGYFFTPQSNPVDILFPSKGSRRTYSLAKSSDTCYVVNNSTKSTENLPKAASNTAALSQDTVKSGGKSYKANVIAIGSSGLFSDGIVNAGTFGNGKYMVDLARYATGAADSAAVTNIPPKPVNAKDITMTSAVSSFLGLGVFVFLIPLSIAAAGIVVFHKRRNL